MADPQKTLQWWAEDPSRLASAGDPRFWASQGLDESLATWGSQLAPLATVRDPEVRRNMLYQQLLDMKGKNDPMAGEFLDAYGGDTGAISRFVSGFGRGVVEGAATPMAAEAFGMDRGLNSGELFDANNIGNIAGNVAGFAGVTAATGGLGMIPRMLALGAHGVGQAIGGHQAVERDKAGAVEAIRATGGEIPAHLQPQGLDSLTSVGNMLAQGGLSAASGGLSSKVQQLMKLGKVVPDKLKDAATYAPMVEGFGAGAAQILDASGGNIADLPGSALAVALGAPMAMGGVAARQMHKQLGGYTPKPIPAHTGHPTPQVPKVGAQPPSLEAQPLTGGLPFQGNFGTSSDLSDMDFVRALVAQPGLDRRLKALEEIKRRGVMQNPSGAEFFVSHPQGFDARLAAVLNPEDMASQGISSLDAPRYIAQQGPQQFRPLQEHRLKKEPGWEFGMQLPGGERFNVPAPQFIPVRGEQQVAVTLNGQRQVGQALFSPGEPDAAGEKFWYVAVQDPSGAWKAVKAPASGVEVIQAPGGGPSPLKLQPQVGMQPMQDVVLDPQVQDDAIERLVELLRLTRQRGNQPVAAPPTGPRPVPSHQPRLPLMDDDIPDWLPRPMGSRR